MKSRRGQAALALAVLGLLVLAACGRHDYEGRNGVPLDGLKVSKSQYGDNWPLNVSRGTLECLDSKAVLFHHGQETYALNDAAVDLNFPSIAPLQKRPSSLGRKQYALALDEGVLSPNIRSYEGFLTAFETLEIYYKEYPEFEERFLGQLGPMVDMAQALC